MLSKNKKNIYREKSKTFESENCINVTMHREFFAIGLWTRYLIRGETHPHAVSLIYIYIYFFFHVIFANMYKGRKRKDYPVHTSSTIASYMSITTYIRGSNQIGIFHTLADREIINRRTHVHALHGEPNIFHRGCELSHTFPCHVINKRERFPWSWPLYSNIYIHVCIHIYVYKHIFM